MRSVPISVSSVLVAAACLLPCLNPVLSPGKGSPSAHGDTFEVDGKPVEGNIVDLVEEGAFIASGDDGETVLWDDLSSFQAKDIRTERVTELRNLRSGAVWVIGTVREVFPQGAVVYADARPRANFGAEFNVPERDNDQPHPRKSRAGAPAVGGWYLIADLPDAKKLIDETVQLIAYPNGNIEEIQLASENDAEKIPTVTLALPPWVGVRAWTNEDGKTIEAELVYVDGGNCIFEKAGQTMVYPAAKLIEADRKIVQICEDRAKDVFIDPKARQ